jgi:hypothetical protein
MKNQITTSTIILFIIAGFVGCKQSDTNHLITIDVTGKLSGEGTDSSGFYGCRIHPVGNE